MIDETNPEATVLKAVLLDQWALTASVIGNAPCLPG